MTPLRDTTPPRKIGQMVDGKIALDEFRYLVMLDGGGVYRSIPLVNFDEAVEQAEEWAKQYGQPVDIVDTVAKGWMVQPVEGSLVLMPGEKPVPIDRFGREVKIDSEGYRYVIEDDFEFRITPCCDASAKGSMGAIVCRNCYEEIDPNIGNTPKGQETPAHDTPEQRRAAREAYLLNPKY